GSSYVSARRRRLAFHLGRLGARSAAGPRGLARAFRLRPRRRLGRLLAGNPVGQLGERRLALFEVGLLGRNLFVELLLGPFAQVDEILDAHGVEVDLGGHLGKSPEGLIPCDALTLLVPSATENRTSSTAEMQVCVP